LCGSSCSLLDAALRLRLREEEDPRVAICVVHPEAPPPCCIFTGKPSDSHSLQWEAPAAHVRGRNMASPRTVTIVALSFALGLFFVFMGTIKLTPRLSKDAYSEMVSACERHIGTKGVKAIVLEWLQTRKPLRL